jgi:hypothetical protein
MQDAPKSGQIRAKGRGLALLSTCRAVLQPRRQSSPPAVALKQPRDSQNKVNRKTAINENKNEANSETVGFSFSVPISSIIIIEDDDWSCLV